MGHNGHMNTSQAPTQHIKQPNRETKLVCPRCGARARMTNLAMARSKDGIICAGDGGRFERAPHRKYTLRRTGTAAVS